MKTIIWPILIVLFEIFLLQGNSAFQAQKYDEALDHYSQAIALEVDDQGLAYNNQGNSYYKMQKYQEAITSYRSGLDQIDKSGKDRYKEEILYNLGNALYKAGEQIQNSNPDETIKLWTSAIDAYEKAIKIDPSDQDAKDNLEFVKNKLQQLQQKKGDKKDNNDQKKDEQKPKDFKDEIERIKQQDEQNKDDSKKYQDLYQDQRDYRNQDPYW